jgi:hypothetical protein
VSRGAAPAIDDLDEDALERQTPMGQILSRGPLAIVRAYLQRLPLPKGRVSYTIILCDQKSLATRGGEHSASFVA